MDFNETLFQLIELEKAVNCIICSKKCAEPVRIKVCGHYFCLKCLKENEPHICPQCKTYYEEREVDYNNIAKETVDILSNLKMILMNSNILVNADCTVATRGKEVFIYDNKTYHMNYIEETFSKVNAKGETPLHVACRRKNLENVTRIIKEVVDLNIKDFAGWAPLHEAVESGSIEIVEKLLRHGALIDIPGPEYETPLHKAVRLQNKDIIMMLLQNGANKDLIDYFGKKPIDCTRNEEVKSLLLKDVTCVNRIEELFCKKKFSIYFYYTEDAYKDKVSKLELVSIIKDFDAKKITHFIIRRNHRLSLKILLAMLEGCFILPQEWVDDFFLNSYFIPIPQYVFISNIELNNGIRRALMNSLLKRPKLFNGICFYISDHNSIVEIHNVKFTKSSITSVICAGGGKVLHRAPTLTICEEIINFPYHASSEVVMCCNYIIFEENNPPALQYHMAEIKHKSSKWLIDCVINFTLSD